MFSPNPDSSSNSFRNFCHKNLSPLKSFDSPQETPSNSLLCNPFLQQENYFYSAEIGCKIASGSNMESKTPVNFKTFAQFNRESEELHCLTPLKEMRSSSKSKQKVDIPQAQTVKKTQRRPSILSHTLLKLAKNPCSKIESSKTPNMERRSLETSEFPNIEGLTQGGKENPHSHCNCSRSQCLKLYCECFSKGMVCNIACRCFKCHNNATHDEIRQSVIQNITARNPLAFQTKSPFTQRLTLGKTEKHKERTLGMTSRGCKCKKSMCRKKYCECFINKVKCTRACKCSGCKNRERPHPSNSGINLGNISCSKAMKIENRPLQVNEEKNLKVILNMVSRDEMLELRHVCLDNRRVHSIENSENWLQNSARLAEINEYFHLTID